LSRIHFVSVVYDVASRHLSVSSLSNSYCRLIGQRTSFRELDVFRTLYSVVIHCQVRELSICEFTADVSNKN